MVRSVTPAGRLSGPALWWRAPWLTILAFTLASPASLIGAWHAVHRLPGVAPFVADSLRALVGVDTVARLEELAYGIEDRALGIWRRGEKPRAYWVVPAEAPAGVLPAAPLALPRPAAIEGHLPQVKPLPVLPPFRPKNVGPMHENWAAPGDGQWVALPESASLEPTPIPSAAPVRMYKTLLHPDMERSYAELFLVALDLRHVRLYLVPGTGEPQATAPEALDMQRPGLIPDEHQAGVLAAFNGGFKTEHGHYGMSVNGVTIVPPVETACTIAYYKDFSLRIGSWPKLKDDVDDMAFWRQTPSCMVEDRKLHPRMAEGFVSRWGSTLDGETVIRRSAVGIDSSGQTLFVGISNHTTAPAIATGMRHAGATTVAQLDVNFSFPKFVTFQKARLSKLRMAVPIAEGFEYSEHEYLRKPSYRDFFYVMDALTDGRTARN
jgi:hypothetical protein